MKSTSLKAFYDTQRERNARQVDVGLARDDAGVEHEHHLLVGQPAHLPDDPLAGPSVNVGVDMPMVVSRTFAQPST